MPIDTRFTFHHEHPPGKRRLLSVADLRGPLRGFLGDQPNRTWKGSGFNLIWRPNFGGEFGTKDFFLELNLTDETLAFTDITGGTGIANRGELQAGVFLGGVAYLQTINDKFDNSGQHFEPGVWLNVPATTNPNEQSSIVRMGTIPHGTTINLQGTALPIAKPNIRVASITPFAIGSADDGNSGLVHFPEEKNIATPLPSRTDPSRLVGVTDAHLANPNLFLSDVLTTQTVISAVELTVTSDSSVAQSVPDIGGGTDNIAFLIGKGAPPAGGPNANSVRVTANFWIERVRDAQGHEFDQLQYTQRVLLNFNGLSWPHITVATLT